MRVRWQGWGANCYHVRVPTRSRGYFFVKGTEKVIFGSGAAEQESNLGQDRWLEGDLVCLGDFVSLPAPPRTSLNSKFNI